MRGLRGRAFVLAMFALVALAAACGGGLSTAKGNYRKGRIAEAKVELVALEEDSHRWSPQRRAEYALYRGLVHHSLGDRAAAGVWLAEAKTLDDTQARALDADDRVRLKLALESLAAGPSTPPAP